MTKETIETCLLLLSQVSVKVSDPEGEDLWRRGRAAYMELVATLVDSGAEVQQQDPRP